MKNWLYSILKHKHSPADGDSAQVRYNDLADIPAGHSGTVTIAATDKTHTLVFVNGILTTYSHT